MYLHSVAARVKVRVPRCEVPRRRRRQHTRIADSQFPCRSVVDTVFHPVRIKDQRPHGSERSRRANDSVSHIRDAIAAI